ncbi:MAG: heme ABC exporter ATP-binding protein CcmA [Pseudomonadota bacterium]
MEPFPVKYGLHASGLAGQRGGAPVYEGATFDLEPGDALQVRGPNGAGKSTLLMNLAGLVPPSDGRSSWRVENQETAETPREAISFMAHRSALEPALTVREHVSFWCAHYRNPNLIENQSAWIQAVNLNGYDDTPAGRLSAGQQRRLDLIRLMIADRPIWILDEPTAFVDAAGARHVEQQIERQKQRGGLTIVATHDRLDIDSPELTIG